jgi:hypothetical protein
MPRKCLTGFKSPACIAAEPSLWISHELSTPLQRKHVLVPLLVAELCRAAEVIPFVLILSSILRKVDRPVPKK